MKASKLFAFSAIALACAMQGAHAQTPLKTIKIGILTDMSGPLADAYGPGSVRAAEMAIEEAKSQFPGVNIELVSANHQNKVDVATTIARKWYDVEKVDAIFDLVNTSVAIAVQGVARERKKIDVPITGASSLTGQHCSPWAIHWSTDTHIQTGGVTSGVMATGGDSWFFITADYSGTREMADQAKAIVKKGGGKVTGEVLFPMGSTDFASAVVAAQGSNAKVINLASGGQDTVNAIKQLAEFGLVAQGKRIVAPSIFLTDIHSLGLKAAQGVVFVDSTYWDLTPETRTWSKRFAETMKRPPTPQQMNVYGAVQHYLKAVKTAGTTDSDAVMKQVRATPINFFNTKNGVVRENGSVVRKRYVFQAKSPAESKYAWDYLKVAKELSLEEGAPVPVAESGCNFTSK
ncbi:ABC transporter substrate-binding protein [Noviherbaspirillum sp.]|uniref:ABC transporter substrate-binding protein n=1 Tax=Noviherbaspirillum sp. TaxID=1926288 RepID=UPI002B483FE2|nr:ABC transporter substrate-binding protein [Noviherbaspirillum sp.]HJV80003.1 ABC transporter substrate-binding protein [Noviherbaspirillum sp.]